MGLLNNIGTQAGGAILGLALAGVNDERQLRQQEELQKLQIQGQKDLTDYSYSKQLQMWKDTNYGPQVEELKKAGLNPALLYGMAGGGGVTTGSGGSTNVQGGNAPSGGREVQDLIGMGIQNQLLQAQKRVLETQADKNEAEANKTKGVDTKEAETRIASLTQGITNQKLIATLTGIETRIKNAEAEVKEHTIQESINYIDWTTAKALEELHQASNTTFVSQATLYNKIDTIKGEMLGVYLRNALTKAQTTKTQSDISVNTAQISKMSQDIAQGWTQLDRNERELKLKTFEAEIRAAYPGLWNVIGGVINNTGRILDNATGQKHIEKPNTNK